MPPEGLEFRRVPEKDTPESAAFEVTLTARLDGFASAIRDLWDAIVDAVLRHGPGHLGVVEVECFDGLHDPETVMGSFVADGEPCPACGAVL